MIHHLGAKLLGLGVVTAGAYAVKHFWHGAGTVVPVTPHGQTVTPGGQTVSPPPAVPGGTNPPSLSQDTGQGDLNVETVDQTQNDLATHMDAFNNDANAVGSEGGDTNSSASDSTSAGDIVGDTSAVSDAIDALMG